jgi:hypothetical protein
MKHSAAVRLYAMISVAAAAALLAAPAQAQFQPRPLGDPAAVEDYHVEGAVALWFPSPDILVASEAFGIPGTTIDFRNDLGLETHGLPAFRVVGKSSSRSKFRFEFIPIKYTSSATLRRTIVFNGQRYDVGLPVNSILDWRAYRFAYEFDFISNDRGFAGFVVDIKYTDVNVDLSTPILHEFARARAPIPAIGGTGRVYVVPNISITGEFTAFKLPENLIQDSRAHYVDFDLYGTVNFTRYVGAQFGFRSFDVGYVVEEDTGDLTLKGVYFGVVARY